MIKVFQDKYGPANGNCMQAALASLLELPLEEVPHFHSHGEDWFKPFFEFLQLKGYDYHGCPSNCKRLGHWGDEQMDAKLARSEGVDGLYYASVYSPGLFDRVQYICNPNYRAPTHAVIIDKDFNIVHDPHPHYQGIKQYPLHEWIGFNGVIDIYYIEKIKK